MARALIMGESDAEILVLAKAACGLLTTSAEYLAVQVSSAPVDEDLAWGTGRCVVRSVEAPFTTDDLSPSGVEMPLREDGDSAMAVLDAARAFEADVIVAAAKNERWLERVFSGSATTELLRVADVPVLVVNADQAQER